MKRFALAGFMLVMFLAMMAPAAMASTVQAKLTGVGLGESSDGYYIDPYTGTINGLPTNGENFFCVDFNHESNIGDTWTAYVTPMTSSDFSDTYLGAKYGSATGKIMYEEMAAVVEHFPTVASGGTYVERVTATWVIWDISVDDMGKDATTNFFGSTPADLAEFAAYESDYKTYENIANAYGSDNFSGWEILTDTKGKDQEFLVYVPEPNSLIFLGFSLLMVAGAVTLKVRKAHA
jgi:hypothetical protein